MLLPALVLAPTGASADDACMSKAMDQASMNDCADQDFKKSDAELNRLYKEIEARLKDDADTKKLLVTAQRAWVSYRDAECTLQRAGVGGGSMGPMIYSMCQAILTEARIKDFQNYLNCKDDVCPIPAAD
nr:lysozyme inhibitor LprI family protein [Sinorhizobium arboris]